VSSNTSVVDEAASPAQQAVEVDPLRGRDRDLSESAGLPASVTTLSADSTSGQPPVVDPALIIHQSGGKGRHRAADPICSGAVTLRRMPGRRSVWDLAGGGPTTTAGQQPDCLHVDLLGLTVRNEVANGGFRWITLVTDSQPEIQIVLSQPHAGRSQEDGDALAALLAKGALPMIQIRCDNLDATFDKVGDAWTVTTMKLTTLGKVPGITQEKFAEAAKTAAETCPISRALKGNVKIEHEAKLE